jgi:hypothetical protein
MVRPSRHPASKPPSKPAARAASIASGSSSATRSAMPGRPARSSATTLAARQSGHAKAPPGRWSRLPHNGGGPVAKGPVKGTTSSWLDIRAPPPGGRESPRPPRREAAGVELGRAAAGGSRADRGDASPA